MYETNDLNINNYFAQNDGDLLKLEKMKEFAITDKCRRSVILSYFNEISSDKTCQEIDPKNVLC